MNIMIDVGGRRSNGGAWYLISLPASPAMVVAQDPPLQFLGQATGPCDDV